MRNIVNRVWLDHVWSPIAEGNKVDSINMMNPSDPLKIIELANNYIKPYFEELPDEQFHRIKETWRYALNTYDDEMLVNSFENALPPFSTPKDIRGFYTHMWLSVFNGEPWQLPDLSSYIDIAKREVSPWDQI